MSSQIERGKDMCRKHLSVASITRTAEHVCVWVSECLCV